MSNAIAFAIAEPAARSPSAATTPAAGPDSSASTGRAVASSAVITPPEDCMIVSGASIPARVEPAADRADVPLHQRPHVRVHDRRRRPLVLALLAQDLARERDRDAGQLLAQDRAELLLVLRDSGTSAAGRRRPTRPPSSRAAPRRRAPRRRRAARSTVAVRGHALVDLVAPAARDERLGLAPERVVHVRDAQAAQLEHVAEARGRDERGAARRGARAPRSSPPSSRARRPPTCVGPDARPATGLDDRGVVARRRREQLADRRAAVRRAGGSRR